MLISSVHYACDFHMNVIMVSVTEVAVCFITIIYEQIVS